MARKRNWEIDWAGPHGTAWGTVNACLTTICLAWVAHLAATRVWPVVAGYVTLGGVLAGALAVIVVLLRAALRRNGQPGATTAYQLACVMGAVGWATYMAGHRSWPWRWWLAGVCSLAVMAFIAGILASLAAPEKPEQTQPQPPAPAPIPTTGDEAGDARNALAAAWEERLDRLCGPTGWKVPGIEEWERGNGYTVEAVAPPGGTTWRAVENARQALYGDLDLVQGGALVVAMGVSQRATLIEVTTVDILAEEYYYPDNRPVHSIRDDLATGFQDDGSPIGPNLLQNCMVLGGEAGSGKTNAGHCLTAEIVTTNDALLWGWELTGGGLWAAWMDPWLRGEVKTPPFDWCAWDARELRWMTRAALRAGYTRKPGYRQAMIEADDDKVPVSPRLPEIVLVGDEIAKVTGALSEHPEAKENLKLITFELRAAAIRAIFLALRGTDDVISSGIQSQCQVKGVMKIASKAEASWVTNNSYGFGPEDTPYPGCGGLSLASGTPLIRKKWFRMKPSQIRQIVLMVDREQRRPPLDELTRLAVNGRHPDGTPMPGLETGELDCYDTRWGRYRAAFDNGVTPAPAAAAPTPTGAVQPLAGTATAVISPADAKAELEDAMASLDAAVSRVKADRLDDDGFALSAGDAAVFEELTREMEAEGFGDDWEEEDPQRPESTPGPADEEVLLHLLREAGPAGVGPKDLLRSLADLGVVIHRDTLHQRLKALRVEDRVHQPRFGRWAWGPKP